MKVIVKKFKSKIFRLLHTKCNWLGKINALSDSKLWGFYIMAFILGRILLFFNPIPYDLVHQIVLTIISLITIYSLKYVYKTTEKIKDASAGFASNTKENNCTSKTLKTFVDQMINMQQSIWWPIIMIFPPLGFIRKNLYLGFIEKNPAGYYAVIFAASTYYLALLGYVQIISALIQFYKISHDEGDCIPLDFPHDTVTPPEWLSLWNELFQKIVRRFFLVGTLFTLEYVLLMPKGVVTIDNKKFVFNVPDVRSFLLSWGTIFVFIIIAFPIIAHIINRMKFLLIKNLGKKINQEYKLLLDSKLSTYSPLDIWAYRQLIETSGKYSTYFNKTKCIIPIVSTLLSFLLNVIKLYESVLSTLLNI